ncbi:SGNH/GDSL hydrolase family protein [Pseudomonas sp. SA3-5]|uniref:SGNH/GDSL hydrolase family protein n=1 Tax=Pseudomonas aestuarii TaxID=3018340 RepID=A0ABT4XFD6_9PSED|nr:SGNH/GDSL hydrolase family protein [Pseudomonas aestuarii]MDA7086897.1 SGNH/GDSL hydrolase family protein [Pseudomonas aestuarii]
MKTITTPRWTLVGLLTLALLAPNWATAQVAFSRIVVFGTSLSDPGNAFALIHRQSTPPYANLDALLVPDAPYASGGHHFSNGATWIEQFARPLGLTASVRPAFVGTSDGASNYAVGGARAREDGINANLSLQVGSFLFDAGGVAPADALYVLEMGSNDVRDALVAGPGGGAILADALAAIGANLDALYAAGARHFLVVNSPDIALTPAVRTLDLLNPGTSAAAAFLSQSFNAGLEALLTVLDGAPGITIARLDLYQTVSALVTDPAAYGLSQVDSACLTPGLPPFTCRTADDYLFWDGIHPTAVVHAIFAQDTAFALTP